MGVSIRFFRDVNFLLVGGDCKIEDVDAIGEMAEVQEGELQVSGVVKKVVEGEIDGVVYCDEYAGCMGWVIPCSPTPVSPTPISPTLDQKVAFRSMGCSAKVLRK